MRNSVITALRSRFDSYVDLISSVDDEALGRKIDVPKHKSLAEHLWCVVGARESYARAIADGNWKGFSCSMTTFSQQDFSEKLRLSSESVVQALASVQDWTVERDRLLLALAEHEVMHEGQVIRHMYGLNMEIPGSVKWA